ncbi:MAG: DUF4428 domain-containing protein [Lachnospiraceae bacterium]|nr:DUF4428 domain-containing protein [Lachnospiraceae bacterium]
MAKVCDICGNKTGWRSFHCQDGVICKECYKIVSNHFTTIITQKTLAELQDTYETNAVPMDLGADGFVVSKSIGAYLLVDETHHKFCLPSNRNITKQYAPPEIFTFDKLDGYMLACEPALSYEQLAALAENRKESVTVQRMTLRLRITGAGVKEIVLIPSPVRSSSYAFRKSFAAAKEILKELDYIDRK